MPITVDVQVSGFAGRSNLLSDGARSHSFQPTDLLRAAILAGFPPLTTTPDDQRLRNWRLASLHLALTVKRLGNRVHLTLPEVWRRLDPSEKGSVKLVLGNIVAKLLVEQLLGAPFFVFLDRYWRTLGIQLPAGRRPDFIALGAGGLRISVEAKGRARKMSSSALEDAKDQAKGVTRVLGAPITAQVVVACHFSAGLLHASLHDPDPEYSLPLPDERLVTDYYLPVRQLLTEAHEDQQGSLAVHREQIRGVQLASVPAADFMVGLRPEVSALLDDNQAATLPAKLKALAPQFAHDRELPTGPDGVVVLPGRSWHEMQKLAAEIGRNEK